MKVENILRRNRTLTVNGTTVTFDAQGVADVDDATGAALVKLGYRAADNKAGARNTTPTAQSAPAAQPEPKAAPSQATFEAPALDSLSVAALRKLAKDRGIEMGDATKKADIISIIEKAQA